MSLGSPESITPRVFSVFVKSNGDITFTELCDEYFDVTVSKAEAVQILTDILNHIHSFD